MRNTSVCPGCGVELPSSGLPDDARANYSIECWFLYGEVAGFELAHPARLGRFHQLAVDAFGAQHAGADGRGIRVAYSLVGLHLSLDRGLTGLQVRDTHQRMGRPSANWPDFTRPRATGGVTVLEVAGRGTRAHSIEGHAAAVQDWAESVWEAWGARHAEVAALALRLGLTR